MRYFKMGKVFYNKQAIPRPLDTYIDKSDGRVLGKFPDQNGNTKRRTIGVAATEDTMYPNELFQQKYPDLWRQYYGNKSFKEYELSIGLYGLTLGVSHKTTLYDLLHDIYGESNVNYILDYTMFCMLERTNTTQLFPQRMRKEVLFSEKLFSDSWYSDFFKNVMTENQNNEFRVQWLYHCMNAGIKDVWLCIDGSNNDCEVESSPLCEQGNAKSHSHSDIVGYMYVVNAVNGYPVSYYVYEGSKPDCNAFHQVALFLSKAGMTIKGVILDSGFCTDEVMQTLEKCSYEYIIMMHSNHFGHTEMIKDFGSVIRWEPCYAVSDEGVFGISSKKQLFKTHSREAYVNLFFDGVRGSMQSIELMKQIRIEKRRVDNLLSKGRAVTVKQHLSSYISIPEGDEQNQCSVYDYEKWKKDANEKGFFSICSSSDFGAETVLSIYHLRDSSETTYSLLKSQEGFHTTRVHSTSSVLNKFAVCFITSIIRTEIELACHSLQLDTNVMLHKLEHIHIFLAPGNEYMFSKSIRDDQKKLLNKFGITEKHLESITSEVNFRLDSNYQNRHRSVPNIKESSNKTNPPFESDDKTIGQLAAKNEDETVLAEETVNTGKKRVGRKKGSKDSYPRKRRTKAELEYARISSS